MRLQLQRTDWRNNVCSRSRSRKPDPYYLTGEDVLDEIFAPREALAEKAEEEDDTFAEDAKKPEV